MTKAIRQAHRDGFVTLCKNKHSFDKNRNEWWRICKEKGIPFVEIRNRTKSSLVSMDLFTIGTNLTAEDLTAMGRIAEKTRSERTYVPNTVRPIFGRVIPEHARFVAEALLRLGMETIERRK